MADTSLQARLKRLFSTNVVVRRVAKNRLKAVDTNHLQSNGTNISMIDKFTGIHRTQNYGSSYSQAYNFHATKIQLFSDYEAMDEDAIISSALDIYADESSVKDASGNTLTIQSSNAAIQKVLHNLFYDILNIDYNLWSWIRNVCKYGDFYLYLDIADDLGIINVIPLSPYEVAREEGFDPENPYDYRFIIMDGASSYANYHVRGTNKEIPNYQIAHFRLLSDTNFLPYGKSMIEPARKVFKQLTLMEDAMLLQRIMRAPERRVFKIDVGNIPPAEVDSYMNSIIAKMKKVPYMDETGQYNLKFNIQNMLEDFYLPVRGSESGTQIDTLEGLTNDGQIEDVEYLRNKMHAALKIPKAFLGYDEGVEGKSTLAAEDVRFARTIERIQKIVVSELTKIAIIHLYSQGFRDSELIDFSISLTNPSLIYKKQQIETLTATADLASKLVESNLISRRWIYENLYNFTDDEWRTMAREVIEDRKEDFRIEQIKSEGNDPFVTGKSFGTPHDIASMHMSGKLLPGMEQEHVAGPGRPASNSTWGTHASPHGRDPLGAKTLDIKPDLSINHTERKTSLSTENISTHEIKLLTKHLPQISKKDVIQETFNTPAIDSEIKDTFLDESQLLGE